MNPEGFTQLHALQTLRERLPEAAKDLKLNLQSVLVPGALNAAQTWGVAVACAVSARNTELRDALVSAARAEHGVELIEDAYAAAALMGMNNVFYKFKHLVGKPSYADKPARLRMSRLVKPSTNKLDFELFCLAVSAIGGCDICVQAHEKVVLEGGMTEEQVHDAVRIASVVFGTAVALESAVLLGAAP